MMRLEMIRMVTDWLNDNTHGLNAKLATVPRDGSDPQPPNVTIYDETRNDQVVDRKPPGNLPAVYVMCDGPITVTGHPMTQSFRQNIGPIWIVLRYLSKSGNPARAVQDAEYTMRAAAMSIAQFMDPANDPTRNRNNTFIYVLASMRFVPVKETVGSSTVSGALLLEFELVRDTTVE